MANLIMSTLNRQKMAALRIVTTLQQEGYEALFAGGCVRDELLGRQPRDYDVATNALPDAVESLFPRTIAIGKAFGVIAVLDDDETVEVATFRKETGTLDGRHPETVQFCAAREDAMRRDFTVNGLFYDPVKETLHDFVGGRKDLQRKRIAAIGRPSERFREDHLRMLRAIRFAHVLGFEIDISTEDAIRDMTPLITNISVERIEMELTKILIDSIRPGDALRHLHQSGLLAHIMPEIIPMIGQKQPPQFHPEGDVFEHTVGMLNLMKERPCIASTYTLRELAYAVLLHDVGKPSTARNGPGRDGESRIRFDGHAETGADMADRILERLKLPNKERRHVVAAIRGHMRFLDVQNMRASTLRRMIGAETFDLELELHRLDCLGSHGKLDNHTFLQDSIEKMKNEPILPEPWINGQDLLDKGIRQGKLIGRLLKEAYDAQMEGRFSSREELLDWIIKHHQ